MIGAIIGDIIGSPFEFHPYKRKDFKLFDHSSRFTDDTVMTIAVMDWYNDECVNPIEDYFVKWGNKYPKAGYGGSFRKWLVDPNRAPYGSWGNGSAMRVSPVGYIYHEMDRTLEDAKRTALPTHDHPEGIKGAQATAMAVCLALHDYSKSEIKDLIEDLFDYDLSRTVDEIRENYKFEVSCQKSVPEAIICFLESTDFEDAIRNAVSLGGDSDTQACITGAIAGAFYDDIPEHIVETVKAMLPDEFLEVISKFEENL